MAAARRRTVGGSSSFVVSKQWTGGRKRAPPAAARVSSASPSSRNHALPLLLRRKGSRGCCALSYCTSSVPSYGVLAEWSARHRSEEHTSELQSLMRISYAVFCLKKKNTYDTTCY